MVESFFCADAEKTIKELKKTTIQYFIKQNI